MKDFLLKLLINALSIFLAAHILSGIHIDSYLNAVLVAFVLSILNSIVKPVLVVLTIPITIVTLGGFLLVINALVILLADAIISSFRVEGFWWALIFSLALFVINYMVEAIMGDSYPKKK